MRVSAPVLEVRDDSFDEVAETVDGCAVSSIVFCWFTVGEFLDRGVHSHSDVAIHLAARAEVSWLNAEMPPSSQLITTLRSPATYSSERLPPMASR